jgi:uncharacterized membrane protein YphA (DoxX/SURF4 family)
MQRFNCLLRVALGGLFILSGVVKIWDVQIKKSSSDKPGRVVITTHASASPDLSVFAQDVLNYRVPPRALNNLVAITVPWIEIVAGLLLVFGVWKRASALVIALMLVVFIVAIGQAVARGLNINCGCFGTLDGRKVGLIGLAEDAVMLAAAAWLVWREKD